MPAPWGSAKGELLKTNSSMGMPLLPVKVTVGREGIAASMATVSRRVIQPPAPMLLRSSHHALFPPVNMKFFKILDVCRQAAEVAGAGRLAACGADAAIISGSGRVRPADVIGSGESANGPGEGVDDRQHLVRLEEQIAEFAHDVAIFLLHFRDSGPRRRPLAPDGKDAVEKNVLAVVPGGPPGVRAVVGQLHHRVRGNCWRAL